ncbi:type II toxin-antitoxin system HicB family antitoxin [uncultured Parasphingopyxis sp.]|uniref:type II toxin-antitoxin system HicB family antitoxin n=1 Tax=uncultured Parasphingopyxis sp. TaxID=1547918 RepID=UPI002627BF81|nr:type II toxin-antitoxin system HicB family antitoxin [uncultured Parasphingopyxis sp.]
MMSYKGYRAAVAFDEGDMLFTGRVAGIDDVVGFHADTTEGLKAAFEEAVADYLVTCAKVGKRPEKSYSGKVMLRMSPAVHAKAALAAEIASQSLNEFSEAALAASAEEKLTGRHAR